MGVDIDPLFELLDTCSAGRIASGQITSSHRTATVAIASGERQVVIGWVDRLGA